MYLSKGEHLMRIAETVSHHPFQDHELSISHHIPEREPPESADLPGQRSEQLGQDRGAGGEIDPLTPIPDTAEGIGRTPVPVAEYTHRNGEEAFPPSGVPERERLEQRDEPREFTQDQGELVGRVQDTQIEEELEWGLPGPSEPCEPPRKSDIRREVPPQRSKEQGGGPSRQVSPLPEQRIVEADKRCQKRLAALARDHIVKLREEREQMAYGWLGEYAEQAFSAKQEGSSLGSLRAEYIHRYNRMLD